MSLYRLNEVDGIESAPSAAHEQRPGQPACGAWPDMPISLTVGQPRPEELANPNSYCVAQADEYCRYQP